MEHGIPPWAYSEFLNMACHSPRLVRARMPARKVRCIYCGRRHARLRDLPADRLPWVCPICHERVTAALSRVYDALEFDPVPEGEPHARTGT